jgi:hypothetical protein
MHPALPRPLALATLISLGLAPVAGHAARPDNSAPTLKVSTLYSGETDLEARGAPVGDVSFSRFSADLELPLAPLSESTRLSAGLGYSGFHLDLGGGAPLPERLESVEARLTARHRFDDRWSLLGTLSPGIHGADGTFSGDGFSLGGLVLASYQVNPRLTLGGGFVFDTLSESMPLMPVVGLRWDFAERWDLTLAFPSSGVSWRASEQLTLRATLDLDVGSFHVEDDPAPGLASKPSLRDTVVDFTALTAGLGADYRLSDSLTLSATLGYNFSRTADYDERGYEVESEDGAPLARLGLTYAF